MRRLSHLVASLVIAAAFQDAGGQWFRNPHVRIGIAKPERAGKGGKHTWKRARRACGHRKWTKRSRAR